MNKNDSSDQNFTLYHRDTSKGRHKLKDLSGKSKEFDTLCVNQS